MTATTADLAAINVLDGSGDEQSLGMLWRQQPIVLVLIRHFG